MGSRAFAIEFFGDLLYWQATEPVDWTLNTNRAPTDQVVAFESVNYDFSTGFRLGVGVERDWGVRLYYTRFFTETENSATGLLTPMFFGGRSAVPTLLDPPYFQDGSIRSAINYNVLDLDFSKSFCPVKSLQLRPVLGLRGAWIDQSFDTRFQGEWLDGWIWKITEEHVRNNFWGIGPKLGIENTLNAWSREKCQIDLMLNFYTAYLLGFWAINDVTFSVSSLGPSSFEVPVKDRNFGALTFQVMAGVHLKYGNWNATAGYEINDWLNQCQIFDDATGPHNNDLIVQGLSARVGYSY